MDLAFVIKHRLKKLGFEQKGLAAAAQVTESYISQLLAGRKAPPAPHRTDVYEKMEAFLKLPRGDLSKLAGLQRREHLQQRILDPPGPLFKEFRELVVRKCNSEKRRRIRGIFEKEPFGEFERLITQKLLDVANSVARRERENKSWLSYVARLGKQSHAKTRAMIREVLETDVFHVSLDNCVPFMDLLIESWDMDLATFGVEIALNRRLTAGHRRKFDFVERELDRPLPLEPGLDEFLNGPMLVGNATEEEIEFLKRLRFKDKRPTPIYYYRELQNLRDPLHFRPSAQMNVS